MKNKLNTPLKKVIFGVLIAAVAVGIVWGGMMLLRNAKRQAINVYAVTDFSTYDYGGGSAESSGMVTTDKLQKVYVSDSQTVKVIYVTEGQSVRKGDKLLSYDTTLNDLDLKRAEINLQRQKLALDTAQDEIDLLKRAQNKEELTAEKAKLEAELATAQANHRGPNSNANLPHIPTASDTDFADYTYIEYSATGFSLNKLNKGKTYILYKMVDGIPENYMGIAVSAGGDISFFNDYPELPTYIDPADGQNDVLAIQKKLDKIEALLFDSYTQAELTKLLNEKTAALDAAKVDYKLAEIDLAAKKKEVTGNTIYSEVTGTVKTVREASEAYQNNEPVVEVSGGGGYYVTGALSEMDLDSVKVGQSVNINSWQTGASCEGEIVSIETYPTTDNGWSNGNPNVSWYPFKVFVREDADLIPGDYVNINYSASSSNGSNSWFLENPFLRTENGKSYVMVRGEDGRLEQRFVQTGRDMWGSYTEICGGLTQEDYIAFPYGKDTVVGAKTREATSDELYNFY